MKNHDDSDRGGSAAREWAGAQFRRLRERAGITQAGLAEALGYDSGQFVSNWERGVSTPPDAILPELARILGVPPRTIIDLLVGYWKRRSREKMDRLKRLLSRAG